MSSTLAGAMAPDLSFGDLGLPGPLVELLATKGITRPLPIQAATVTDALEGRDGSGRAPTGSGKTLAFALPMAARVGRAKPRRPKAFVLAPTRELAAQLARELSPLLGARGLRAQTFYRGVGFGDQRQALRKAVDVPVACPGRIEDLLRSRDIMLGDVEMVVIDEADRMADMGFLPAVRRILDVTNIRRHADRLARQLSRGGVRAEAMHGGRSQPQRDRTMAAFRAGRIQALVATDVAARGIHVDSSACVIHFDLPNDVKEYVHRSGRTARVGEAGKVAAFVLSDQIAVASAFRRGLDIDIEGTAPRANETRSAPASDHSDRQPNRLGADGQRPRQRTPHGRAIRRRRNFDR